MALTPRRAFVSLWLTLLLLKLWLVCVVPVFEDEAWYWLEGRHLAWAYSDLPALTAWLARLGVDVAGNSLPGLRWPFLLLGSAIPWLSVRIGARWLGEDAGWQAGLLALLLPLASAAGVLALPDVPLVFATLLAFDACLAMLDGVTWGACLQLAVALATGAMSHYRFVFALAGGAAGMFGSREGRALLRDRRVLIALVCGAMAWLPIALFNIDQHAAGLRFQFVDRHPWSFHAYGLTLQAGQPLLVGPVLYIAAIWALVQAWKRRSDPRWTLLLGSAGVPIMMFVGLAPFADIHRVSFHWPLSAYLVLMPCVPWLLRDNGHRRWHAWILVTNGLLCVGFWLMALQVVLPGGAERLARMGFYPKMFAGTKATLAQTRTTLAEMPADTVLVADNFTLASKLEFGLGGTRKVIALDHKLNAKHGRALQLALWKRDESALPSLVSHPILLVVDEDVLEFDLREPWNRHICAVLPGLRDAGETIVDGGRQHFLFYRREPGAGGACAYPSLAFVRSPVPGARVSGAFDVDGWAFQDGTGVATVEVLLDGRRVAAAHYGIEDVEVRSRWPASDDPFQPDVGFAAHVDLHDVSKGEHNLALRVTGRDGRVRELENRAIRVKGA